ncbi:hypothetical protein CBR_g41741 [Chara braunii]|uniref:4-hydroxyphenylpyruvate dioxygenase n=1 Tax=Chara braunii TaxID=69332 RepID=A0A388LWT7_CHABU|nr:hypothetical protein CBR_g41741 [Chara braunii]|eukprot:GBG86679.1 hypothetical protein CBR_g41741 [Chara braunii]
MKISTCVSSAEEEKLRQYYIYGSRPGICISAIHFSRRIADLIGGSNRVEERHSSWCFCFSKMSFAVAHSAFPILSTSMGPSGNGMANGGAETRACEPVLSSKTQSLTTQDPRKPALDADTTKTVPQKLVGHKNFVRENLKSDRFVVKGFHHVEFYCGDALNVSHRFAWAMGMRETAQSNLTTGNHLYSSRVLQSGDITFVFTAPYSKQLCAKELSAVEQGQDSLPAVPHPHFNPENARSFFDKHGVAVAAVGLLVGDAATAYEESTKHGGIGMLKPVRLVDATTGGVMDISEVVLYGDVVLRYVSTPELPSDDESMDNEQPPREGLKPFQGPFLPNYRPVEAPICTLGLTNIDHVVGNVPQLLPAVQYIANMTGFHEFAEFVAEDVGTVDSGLNSMVMADNSEKVLMPVNEPTFGTKRQSQIQTYLEHNEGPGVQHIALACDDIFHTLRQMRARSSMGGFEFMPRASDAYYKCLPEKFGEDLTPEQLQQCKELGILVDKDDQGLLLQIFTRPVGDRPTIFIEIIQRVGCMEVDQDGNVAQRGGCGGFGKGNFSELFKSIEEFEKTFD